MKSRRGIVKCILVLIIISLLNACLLYYLTQMSSEVTCNVTNYLTLDNKAKYYYEKGHSHNTEAYERICPEDGEPVQLLILIATTPVNYAKRMAIRQTWGGHYGLRRDVAVGFMLGRTENPFIERSLRNENHLYGDMIRGNFIDWPRNVTLKTVSMLEWTLKFCSKVNYLLKANDDAFINVGKLLEFVGSLLHEERSIYGQLNVCSKPVRSGKTKNQVSWRDFSGPFYPPFLSGNIIKICIQLKKNTTFPSQEPPIFYHRM